MDETSEEQKSTEQPAAPQAPMQSPQDEAQPTQAKGKIADAVQSQPQDEGTKPAAGEAA